MSIRGIEGFYPRKSARPEGTPLSNSQLKTVEAARSLASPSPSTSPLESNRIAPVDAARLKSARIWSNIKLIAQITLLISLAAMLGCICLAAFVFAPYIAIPISIGLIALYVSKMAHEKEMEYRAPPPIDDALRVEGNLRARERLAQIKRNSLPQDFSTIDYSLE
ncbi:MAG: hypothetical protein JSS32_05475 [Verrucomicrobia bacterium]|nr:hypothetical protein [Verrucomicrobiota bacterium]